MAYRADISIHAPRMGSDWPLPSGCVFQPVFQSTLPGWGATGPAPSTPCACDFNPRSPDGERPALAAGLSLAVEISIHAPRMGSDGADDGASGGEGISIHAPRMGSDSGRYAPLPCIPYFNPRSPDGERLVSFAACRQRARFQSTLPGWGATGSSLVRLAARSDFNPRSPDGERRCVSANWRPQYGHYFSAA